MNKYTSRANEDLIFAIGWGWGKFIRGAKTHALWASIQKKNGWPV
jgi:hypothetical protein